MGTLFEDQTQPDPDAVTAGQVVQVALNANLWRHYDYLWPAKWGSPQVGQRVHVPLGKGNRKNLAFVAATDRPHPDEGIRLKSVLDTIDDASAFDECLWDLGQWISRYYLAPLGMTLAAMVPSAVGRYAKRTEQVVSLTEGSRRDWPKNLGSRQKRVLDELYESRKQGVEPVPLELLLAHSGGTRDTVRRLQGRGLIRTETRQVVLPELTAQAEGEEIELNEDQARAVADLQAKLGAGFSVTLLHGVTGSGKTEVYIRAIREVMAAGQQVILLVPEIALATQTLHRLLTRLPRVAVLHSGLTGPQRAFYWQQIRDGHASVIVGPRSAVFAPTRDLGLIVVDEEHESSYKQDVAPAYHGRDVAVKRASLAGVPVILGSATPSLESLHNVQQGRYDRLRLPRRVRGLSMPKLEIVHLRKELTPGRIELIGRTLTQKVAGALDREEQIILLLNRRGYASYIFCPSCQWMYSCEHCTRPLVFHQASRLVMCHYCQHSAPLPEFCPACHGKIVFFGLGIQRIESELGRKFPLARVARMDSDTMTSPKQFRKVFDAFASGEIDMLLGTQMMAKGLDFPRVSLVGVVSADTSLSIPDFRASERTFQLIVQVAGRAGRSDLPGEVVVQTLNPEEPAITYAAQHDYDGFSAIELPLRQETCLPPASRMVRFIVRHRDPDRAEQGAEQLAEQLRRVLPPGEVTLIGPQPAGVQKIRDFFRCHLVLISPRPGLVQRALRGRMDWLTRNVAAEIIPDVDPLTLM
ncbi:MAG: replication restart helicase PriA [Planctomycetota bacterium]